MERIACEQCDKCIHEQVERDVKKGGCLSIYTCRNVESGHELCKTLTRPAPDKAEVEELRHALDEIIILQRHYASLLNQYDGGNRKGFASADEWIGRLREVNSGNHKD